MPIFCKQLILATLLTPNPCFSTPCPNLNQQMNGLILYCLIPHRLLRRVERNFFLYGISNTFFALHDSKCQPYELEYEIRLYVPQYLTANVVSPVVLIGICMAEDGPYVSDPSVIVLYAGLFCLLHTCTLCLSVASLLMYRVYWFGGGSSHAQVQDCLALGLRSVSPSARLVSSDLLLWL